MRTHARAPWLPWTMVLLLAAGGACRGGGGDAPSGAGGSKPRPVVGVTFLTQTHDFYKELEEAMRKEAAARGLDLIVTSCEMDPAKQASQLEDFVAQRVAAIIAAPCDSAAIGANLQGAEQAGIPVFTVDIAARSGKIVSHVASDNVLGGRLAAQALARYLERPGQGPHHRSPDRGLRPGPHEGLRRGAEEDAGDEGRRAAVRRRAAREGHGGDGGHAAGPPGPQGRVRHQRRFRARGAVGPGSRRAQGHRHRGLRRHAGGAAGDPQGRAPEGRRRPAPASDRSEGRSRWWPAISPGKPSPPSSRSRSASWTRKPSPPSEPALRNGTVQVVPRGVAPWTGWTSSCSPGEVHALLGENGAGKSTLIKILGGAVVPDGGEALLDGEPLPLGDPLAVRRRGINVVYQELTLVPELTVAENIFLGRERGRPLLRRRDMARTAHELLDGLGARVAAGAPVRTLSVAQQQLVEIARALANESKVIILDEPSATLSGPEVRAPVRRPPAPAGAGPRHRVHLPPARGDLRPRRPGHGASRRTPRGLVARGRRRPRAAHPLDGGPRRHRGVPAARPGARRRRPRSAGPRRARRASPTCP